MRQITMPAGAWLALVLAAMAMATTPPAVFAQQSPPATEDSPAQTASDSEASEPASADDEAKPEQAQSDSEDAQRPAGPDRREDRREGRQPRRGDAPSAHEGREGGLGVAIAAGPDGEGVVVVGVQEGSPAAKAGIKQGDRILSVADQEVTSPRQVGQFIRQHAPGKDVEIRISRDGQEQTVQARLATRTDVVGAEEAAEESPTPEPDQAEREPGPRTPREPRRTAAARR